MKETEVLEMFEEKGSRIQGEARCGRENREQSQCPCARCSYTAALIQVTAALDYLTGESPCSGESVSLTKDLPDPS